VYINVFLLSQVDSNKQCFHNPVYAYLSAARNSYHSPGPSHDWIGQYNGDKNTQRTSEKPRPHTLPKPLDEDGGGKSEENISELEINMLLAFEEQKKSSSATAPSSARPHRHFTE
jgi:hypothetical protein